MLGKDASFFLKDYSVRMSISAISSGSADFAAISSISMSLLAAANQEQGAMLSLVSSLSSGTSIDTYA